MYSVRYDNHGNLVNGKPCHDCIKFLLNLGFTKTVYSTDNNELIISKLYNMDNKQSSGNRS